MNETNDLITCAKGALKEGGLDGWLIYDNKRSNISALPLLKIPAHYILSRRLFYWIPASGEPIKLVHAIEPHTLDHLPGTLSTFASWRSLAEALKTLLAGKRRIAMEYSPNAALPSLSHVDGGTLDLIRLLGVEVVSSAPCLQAALPKKSAFQQESHIQAATICAEAASRAFDWIKAHLDASTPITEFDVQEFILGHFAACDFMTEHAPNVSVNANTADPHYNPTAAHSLPIKRGDWILIDLFCKKKQEGALYADLCFVATAAAAPTPEQQALFDLIVLSRNAALSLIQDRLRGGEPVYGFEVDNVARAPIELAGYGPYFLHRTGHDIDESIHGSGAHLDDFETHDIRRLLPDSCFSIEPGIYLPGQFGVRLECNVFLTQGGEMVITGSPQDKITCL